MFYLQNNFKNVRFIDVIKEGEEQMNKLKALKLCLVLNVLLGSNAYLVSPVLADDTSSQENGGGNRLF